MRVHILLLPFVWEQQSKLRMTKHEKVKNKLALLKDIARADCTYRFWKYNLLLLILSKEKILLLLV